MNNDRCVGCVIGGMIGDVLGAKCEWQSYRELLRRYDPVDDIFNDSSMLIESIYSDDTQMTIGVIEEMVDCKSWDKRGLLKRLVDNAEDKRGYGRGMRDIVNRYRIGHWQDGDEMKMFNGGSHGNGSSVRVSPIGLLYGCDTHAVRRWAAESSMATHAHELAIEGACIVALCIGYLSRIHEYNAADFKLFLSKVTDNILYQERINKAISCRDIYDLVKMGSDIGAVDAVPTAIASFLLSPTSYKTAVSQSICIGGDTDSVASLCGSMVGALLGWETVRKVVDEKLLVAIERDNAPKGITYINDLMQKFVCI